ncbi:hypothetical protein SASPL_103624 [Salvia splendens]|uniref:Uncharacterized protein n=1 Tax=Salvia splendens TaxID=180675 RepID=A0A8X8YGH3_SALSN|nr:hypothetical protein SASPL_103624 [Salvia splendens]
MPQLRHVMSNPGKSEGAYYVPDPLSREDMVLENLQTLLVVSNLKFGEGVLRRIPNIKALKLYYDGNLLRGGDDYCLNNLYRLQKHESLRLNCSEEHTLVCLVRQMIPSLDIGDIPTLESIKLDRCSESVVDSARRIQEE